MCVVLLLCLCGGQRELVHAVTGLREILARGGSALEDADARITAEERVNAFLREETESKWRGLAAVGVQVEALRRAALDAWAQQQQELAAVKASKSSLVGDVKARRRLRSRIEAAQGQMQAQHDTVYEELERRRVEVGRWAAGVRCVAKPRLPSSPCLRVAALTPSAQGWGGLREPRGPARGPVAPHGGRVPARRPARCGAPGDGRERDAGRGAGLRADAAHAARRGGAGRGSPERAGAGGGGRRRHRAAGPARAGRGAPGVRTGGREREAAGRGERAEAAAGGGHVSAVGRTRVSCLCVCSFAGGAA